MTKLNPNEAPKGYVAVDGRSGCQGCDLYNEKCRSDMCCSMYRQDGHNVIFKRKPAREFLAWAVIGDWPITTHLYPTRDAARAATLGRACGGNLIRVKITEII